MGMKDLIDYAVSNGLSVVIICYFLFRDWKYNSTLIQLMCELKECIDKFNNTLDKEAQRHVS